MSRLIRSLRGRRRTLLACTLLLCAASAVAVALVATRSASLPRSVNYTELVRIAAANTVTNVEVRADQVLLTTASAGVVTAVVGDSEAMHRLVQSFADAGVPVEFEAHDSGRARALEATLPIAAIFVLAGAYMLVQRRRQGAHINTFAAGSSSVVRFADVAGIDEVKDALTETVDFLRSPKDFGRLGGRAPRGVLLTGEPGTGKTLLARAIASESGVPFLSVSGSSFQEMYVGVGAARVRRLFAEARKVAPCIVFIDEIDAVGRARGKAGDSSSAEHDQTLNQLLVEMDGFDHSAGIVVVASTNRPDVLDPAVLRPGRFDRQVTVPLPDLRGRMDILAVHARAVRLGDDVDLATVAKGTPGFSGAELANLLNEAAICAARDRADAVTAAHIDIARDRVLMGAERKNVLIDEEERHATAVHEAGHVAVGVVAKHTDPVHKVSILPRGRALGVTQSVPEKDRLMYRKEYLEDQICLLLGGRAAELEILGTMTAGAADDIERATNLAHRMVSELGMSEIGPICLKDAAAHRSQQLMDRVEETTRTLLDSQLQRARAIVVEHRAAIGRLVSQLLEKETLDADAIRACF